MSQDDDDLDQRPQPWDNGIVLLAAMLTLCAIAAGFYLYEIPLPHAPPPPAQTAPANGEVTIGIGQGSTIHHPSGGNRP